MALKYFYYVIVKSNQQAKFVTAIDNASKTARWKDNGKPLSLSKSVADDLAWCLTLNFHPTFVLKSYHEIKKQIFIKEDEPSDEEK